MDPAEPMQNAYEDIPNAVPERWETAIEDLAQAIALGLDRAQDLADVINDTVRTRPIVAKAVGAAVVGAIIGTALASKQIRAERSKREAALRAAQSTSSSVVEQAASIARTAAERIASRAPSREDVVGAARGVGGTLRERRSAVDIRTARYAAQIIPLALALLKNPLVRELVVRAAIRGARAKR